MVRFHDIATIVVIILFSVTSGVHAQSLEPRAYANAPIGLNFLLVGYQNSTGGLVFDPAVPVEDAETDVDIGFLGYIHTLDVAGNSSKVGMILPYSSLAATGFAVDPNGSKEFRTRDSQGLADPLFFFSMNFFGAPATSLKDFKNYKQDTIVGFTITVVPPLGIYDSDKLINIGTNRWTIKPGIGVSKAVGKWTLEASADVALYTDNNDFFNGQTREQDPIYSSQLHVTYNFPRNIWLAISATYFTGGETAVDGVTNDDHQSNTRTGFTLALPINRKHSLKLYGSSGVSTRTGSNYDAFGIFWQYRWGGGI